MAHTLLLIPTLLLGCLLQISEVAEVSSGSPLVSSSVRTIKEVRVEYREQGFYNIVLKNEFDLAIDGLVIGNSTQFSGDRVLAPAAGVFSRLVRCRQNAPCQLHIRAAVYENGSCLGEVEPCRSLMAMWRGRRVAADLLLRAFRAEKLKGDLDPESVENVLLTADVTRGLATAADDIISLTQAPHSSREEIQRSLLLGANSFRGRLGDRLAEWKKAVKTDPARQPTLTQLLEGMIAECARIMSEPPARKDAFRL